MTYNDAVNYILEIPKFTKKNDALHTRNFLEYLDNPQDHMKVIHVAGTNGKGSVCVYLDGMLRSEGKRTGLFVSPHLVKINERIVINGKEITDDRFLDVFMRVLRAVSAMKQDGMAHPTFFEFLFGMALCAFDEENVEYAVLETGLGGRLDATNAIERPLACVITSIGLDHMQYLGNTLSEIAGEKAGIIKPGVPVFFTESGRESDKVIEKTAEENNSYCKKIGKDAYEILGIEDKHIAFSCSSAYYGNTTWKLNNTAVYQPGNAMTALEVMRFLFSENGNQQLWRIALNEIKWQGRMEEILPDVYIDGAHNISAVKAFKESIPDDGKENIILFSAVKDKDYRKMAEYLCKNTDACLFVVTHIEDDRGTDAKMLGDIFRNYTDRPVVVKENVKDALEYVISNQQNRRIYCLGSLYLTGMIKGLIQEVG